MRIFVSVLWLITVISYLWPNDKVHVKFIRENRTGISVSMSIISAVMTYIVNYVM